MNTFKLFVFVSVLFSVAFSAITQRSLDVIDTEDSGFVAEPTTGKKIVEIVEDFLPVALDRVGEETSEYTAYTSESGFGRITKAGIRVTKGASAHMYYDIVVRAVDAETLNTHDQKFTETLTTEEWAAYNAKKSVWKGTLDVPLFSWIGADFSKKVTKESFEAASSTTVNYEAKAKAASELLESVSTTKIRISGSLKATGISFRPTEAFVFIKLAKVKFDDGSNQYIVSNHADDVVAGTGGGDELPTESPDLDITCEAGFYC